MKSVKDKQRADQNDIPRQRETEIGDEEHGE